MDITERIETLVTDLIKDGVSHYDISWIFNSVIQKAKLKADLETDTNYRLGRPLPTSRFDENADLPTGDCETLGESITKQALDEELEMYMSHVSYCDCYIRTDTCPICQIGSLEYKINCCGNYFHHNCLAECYQSGHTKCPLCRHDLRLEKIGDSLKVVADVEPITQKLGDQNSDRDDIRRNINANRSNIDTFNQDRVERHLQDMDNNARVPIVSVHVIRAVPVVGIPNIFIDIEYYGFVIRLEANGDLTATGIIRDGSTNILHQEPLTEQEKVFARNLGLSIIETPPGSPAPMLHNSSPLSPRFSDEVVNDVLVQPEHPSR